MHLINALGTGGAQMVIYQIAKFADRDKFDLTICGCIKSGHYEDAFKEIGVYAEAISNNRRSIYLFPLFVYDIMRTLLRILRIIKDRKIDLIHTHLPDSSTYGVVAGKLSGKPVVVSIHNNIIIPIKRRAPFRNWLRKIVINAVYRRADMIVCCGEDVAKSMKEKGHVGENVPVKVIMNGIDYEKFAQPRDVEKIREKLGLPLESKVISCVSRLEVSKGHTYLIQAAARLKNKHPLLRVLVVGDGSLINELQEQANKEGVAEHICFLGRRSDVPDILAASDIFVLPSLHEGVPLVVLEAMAAQKPVVATNIPGTRELITDGGDGFLVQAQDEAGLADKLDELLSNPETGRSMGEKARAKVKKQFTAKMMVEKFEAAYQNVLEGR